MKKNTSTTRLILLTGATGYVGGRLLRAFNQRGEKIRCLTRRAEEMRARVDSDVEVFAGNVLDQDSLEAAMVGVDVAFYLVHSMGTDGDFSNEDRIAAKNFAEAAEQSGVRRIVYLGGLGGDDVESTHLRSRHEVGRIFRGSSVETIELRASIIIGSGSLSFEMIRNLVNKLPFMITPRWVYSRAQPISIEDVLEYLVRSMDVTIEKSEIVEIGGADQVGYIDIMRAYAEERGLRRLIVPLPVLSPYLSSLWLGLVTPLYAQVGRKIIDSVKHDTLVTSDRAETLFSVIPMGMRAAIKRALVNEDQLFAETRWSDAFSSSFAPSNWGGEKFGSRVVDSRMQKVRSRPGDAFVPIRRIGGNTGWYYANWLWRLRGFIDLFFGGPGMRRGRRDPDYLFQGDALDFWRVDAVKNDSFLRLRAEMRVPGRAWLQFEVDQTDGDYCIVRQTAIFEPKGFGGLLYWYGIYPLHAFIFRGLFRGIISSIKTPS